jgi:threonine dehydratase
LISGSSIAAHALSSGIRIFGVEPEDANDTFLSLQAGRRVEIPTPRTIADGLRTPTPGAITFPIIQKHVEGVVLVSDTEIRDTMQFLLTRMKMLVEPSGAVSAAALLRHKLPTDVQRVGAILSGGNTDLELG